MKKYNSILRYGKGKTSKWLEESPQIVIQEKLDGANASFKVENGEILCFSRNQQLNEGNTLRGFYGWVQENKEVLKKAPEGLIFYGEWLCRHKLDYGENENQFYLFDVFYEDLEKFMPMYHLESFARFLNLKTAPLFYEGTNNSIEHIQSYVGKSQLGEVGEGVVVKYTGYRKEGEFCAKFVSDEFAEKAKTKKHKVDAKKDSLDEFVESVVSKARVSKNLHKLVDEGVLKEDFDASDLGAVLKNIFPKVFEDIVNEDMDELIKLLKSKVGKKVPQITKEVMKEEGRM